MKEPRHPATQPWLEDMLHSCRFAIMLFCNHAVLQSCCFAVMLFCRHAVITFLNKASSPSHPSLFSPTMISDQCLRTAPFVPATFRMVTSFSFAFPRHGCFALFARPSLLSRCNMALRRDPTMIVGGKYARIYIIFDHVVPGSVICRIQETEATTHTQPARTAS